MNNQMVIERIKSNVNVPLYLWGCGNVAHEVYELLSENSITINGCVVDVNTGVDEFMGMRVENLMEVINRENSLNIVICHAQYHRKKELEQYHNILNIYYFPNPFKTHEDITEEYYDRHFDEFSEAKKLFKDELSRKVFDAYIESRVHGNVEAVFDAFTYPMSFFDNDVWKLSRNEVYVDCGGYNGDTVIKFINACKGEYKAVYAFEPDPYLYKVMNERIIPYNDGRIYTFKEGLWNADTVLTFDADEEQSGHVVDNVKTDNDNSIKVCRLDDAVNDKISIIKISISGSMVECIEGSSNIIHDLGPKLVMTVGITKERLYKIPLLLKSLNPNYELYLRFNESMPSRICLYAK